MSGPKATLTVARSTSTPTGPWGGPDSLTSWVGSLAIDNVRAYDGATWLPGDTPDRRLNPGQIYAHRFRGNVVLPTDLETEVTFGSTRVTAAPTMDTFTWINGATESVYCTMPTLRQGTAGQVLAGWEIPWGATPPPSWAFQAGVPKWYTECGDLVADIVPSAVRSIQHDVPVVGGAFFPNSGARSYPCVHGGEIGARFARYVPGLDQVDMLYRPSADEWFAGSWANNLSNKFPLHYPLPTLSVIGYIVMRTAGGVTPADITMTINFALADGSVSSHAFSPHGWSNDGPTANPNNSFLRISFSEDCSTVTVPDLAVYATVSVNGPGMILSGFFGFDGLPMGNGFPSGGALDLYDGQAFVPGRLWKVVV